MKANSKQINGRTVRQSGDLWDLMDQRCGQITGGVVYTGTIREISEAIIPVGTSVLLTSTDESGLAAIVAGVHHDGDFELVFEDGETGSYSADEFEVLGND